MKTTMRVTQAFFLASSFRRRACSLLAAGLLVSFSSGSAQAQQDYLALQTRLMPVPATANKALAEGSVWQWGTNLELQVSEATLQRMLTHFQAWFARKSPQFQIHDIRMQEGELQITATVYRWFFYDRLTLRLDFPQQQALRLQVRDNWFPTWAILDQAQEALKDTQVLDVERAESQVQAEFKTGSQGLGELGFLPHQFEGRIDDETMHLALVTRPLVAADPSSMDSGQLFSESGVLFGLEVLQNETKHQVAEVQAAVQVNLEQAHLTGLKLGGETLLERLQGYSGTFDISAQILPGGSVNGLFQMGVDKFIAEGKTYGDIRSVPFDWSLDFDVDGEPEFHIWPDLPELAALPPEQLDFSRNAVRLFIDGPDYFAHLKEVLPRARRSIEQEIFVFYDGTSTRELARIFWLKALGLQVQDGQFTEDTYAPEGIPVRLLHNHKLTHAGAARVDFIFETVRKELWAALQADAKWASQLPKLAQRGARNLQVLPLSQGVMHSDHRKLLLIDEELAYTGGLNLADHYLTDDGFHDVMVQVQGPAVQAMRTQFVQNWHELQDIHAQSWQSIAPVTLSPERSTLLSDPISHEADVAVLTTDYDSQDIARALRYLLDHAQKVIRLEHAYLDDAPTEAALRRALDRGVQVEIVFSKRNDEAMFEVINPATVRDLMRMYPDQVKTWLYSNEKGKATYMAHTKYLSVDGREALVGSANLIPRSLFSPFTQGTGPILFNEELSLWIRDEAFVKEMDQRILNRDIERFGHAYSVEDLNQLILERGGAWKLLVERLKGILS